MIAQLLSQFFDDYIFAITVFIFIVLIAIICDALQKHREKKEEPAPVQRRPAQYPRVTILPTEPTPSRRIYAPPSRLSEQDVSSSPVGGSCLSCGAIIHEETLSHCPECDAERQRCPICLRFIAGGQELLACPHCKILGHANELIEWIDRHETCPYCGRRVRSNELLSPEDLPNNR